MATGFENDVYNNSALHWWSGFENDKEDMNMIIGGQDMKMI